MKTLWPGWASSRRAKPMSTPGSTGVEGGGGAWPGLEVTRRATRQHAKPHWCGGCRRGRRAWLRCRWAAAGPGRKTRRTSHQQTGATGVKGAGGSGGPGRASRSTTPSEARVWSISRAAGPGGAQNTGGAPSNNTLRGRLADGPPPTGTHSGQTKTHQPRGGRRSGGARTTGARANRPYSPPPGSERPV